MKLSRLALAVALLPVAPAFAAPENALKLADTVITANREAQPRGESTAAVSVFTRADLDRLRPASVPELLKRVPGVQITQSGGRGSDTHLYIRGTNNGQALVLIDGQRIGSISAGYASLQALSIEQIERVEVLRGSRSALYGADAIGGVVQIFTRRSSGEGLQP
ncbi:MAG TPA: TonB-dependent receptor plug domain-containing protein, partial [Pseudomonas sp.]|nr:TonB-dependent receptor plug domain-containing protein [Pseudomonas sp.]